MINDFHRTIVEELAPMRVIKTRRNMDIMDSKVSALRKRRDRKLKAYYKTGDDFYLNWANNITKEMKANIKKRQKRKYEQKACTQDPKAFWNLVKEISGKTRQERQVEDRRQW